MNATFPQLCYIVCASSEYRMPSSTVESYGQTNSKGCPFPGEGMKNEFGQHTIPAALRYDGTPAGFALTNIRENEDGSVALNVDIDDMSIEDEPIAEGDTVWHETFDTNILLSTIWWQETLEGSGKWHTRYSGGTTDYNSWVELTPVSSGFGIDEKVTAKLELSNFELGTDAYVLSFKTANKDDGAKWVNSISIQIYSGGAIEHEKKFDVLSEAWTIHSVDISNITPPWKLCITGTCQMNSTLKLDDIVIRRKHLPTGIKSTNVTQKDSRVYNIKGQQIYSSKGLLPGSIYVKNGKKAIAL